MTTPTRLRQFTTRDPRRTAVLVWLAAVMGIFFLSQCIVMQICPTCTAPIFPMD